jgi:dienelactone hydrolase
MRNNSVTTHGPGLPARASGTDSSRARTLRQEAFTMKQTAALNSIVLSVALLGRVALAADPAGSGPEPAIVYSDLSLPTHTIYRPELLRGEYPVVLWANGGCIDSNFGYREFLAEVASHGFIVLAIGPHRDTPPPQFVLPPDPADWPPFETHFSQMLEGLDWIVAENERPGSLFEGKVDVASVATMGSSCGGLQTIKASVDPRISTALVLNSGMMADGDQYMERHEVQRSILAELRVPIAYFIGGESDMAYPNAEADWRDLQRLGVDAVNANLDVGHGATYDEPNGGAFARGPLAWLQWQLKGDRKARAMFVGEDCGFCAGSDWSLRRHFPERP